MQQQKQRRMQRHQILLAGDPQYTNTEEEKQNIPTLRPPATTARPDGLPDISPDLSEPPVPVQEPAPTITGKLLSNCRRAGDVSAPGEAIGSNEADELTEAAAAREAAACASSALAHGHPIVSDAGETCGVATWYKAASTATELL
ncbi:hypothetical protein, conserved [Eimeria tenella]|uniref:Uncharacterized protein n=1 Tax=Eimeria tenella TaxID=5802 RepID=U6L5M9_EIMTE|nr:hypothetical protein, conserved [Eimeria tenella]CDJ45446.1 hypothetical protein, conserved [Eimeria tenella]|eukprot:XP_013236192.1 hypothetical protein, conserved [Eimeria tenella]